MNAPEKLRLMSLLAWAVDFVEHETKVMRDSFCDEAGNCDDEDVAVELRDAERWLVEAREALK